MRRIILLLAVLLAPFRPWAAVSPDALLKEAQAAARTNLQTSLRLCDEAVRANPTNAQARSMRARVLDRLGREDDAIGELTAALKLEPDNSQFFQARGELNFRAGHFPESVGDFDRVIQLHPGQAPYHWQRGISLYYAGRFADGRKQFETHQTVNPNDVENAIWHFLCVAREKGVTNARAAMLPVGPDGRIPMPEINALYRGTGTVDQVLAAAQAAGGDRARDALFFAHLYLGLYFDALGETAKARAQISKAAADATATHYMGDVARVHARRLSARNDKR